MPVERTRVEDLTKGAVSGMLADCIVKVVDAAWHASIGHVREAVSVALVLRHESFVRPSEAPRQVMSNGIPGGGTCR